MTVQYTNEQLANEITGAIGAVQDAHAAMVENSRLLTAHIADTALHGGGGSGGENEGAGAGSFDSTALEESIANNTASITANTAEITGIKTRLETAETSITDYGTRTGQNETVLTEHGTKITGLETSVSGFNEKIENLKTSLNPIPNAIGAAQTDTGEKSVIFDRIDVNGRYITGRPDFDNHRIYNQICEKIIDGQNMIRIPKFFYRRGVPAGGITCLDAWSVSDIALPGYELHPAFLAKDGETPLDQIWIGKYQATYDPKVSAKAASCISNAGSFSSSDQSFDILKAKCAARNLDGVTGFHMMNIHEWAAIQILMLVEYAGTDFQVMIANGFTSSGTTKVEDDNVTKAGWRGITGLWGNYNIFCDNIKIQDNKIWINMGKGYVNTGKAMPGNIQPGIMGKGSGAGWNMNHLFIADDASSAASGTFPDNQAFSNGCVPAVGGGPGSYKNAGLFALTVTCVPSTTYSNNSTRLAKW